MRLFLLKLCSEDASVSIHPCGLWRVLWSYRTEPHNKVKEDESHFRSDVLVFLTVCLFNPLPSSRQPLPTVWVADSTRASGSSPLRFNIHCPGASRQDVLTSRVEVMTKSPIKQTRKRQTSDKHPAFLYSTEHLWGDSVPQCRWLLISPSGWGVQAAGIPPINDITSAQIALDTYNSRTRTGGFRIAELHFLKLFPL